MSDQQIVCSCSKGSEIDLIQKDIRELNKNYTSINAQINNGISTEVPLLRKAFDKLAKEFRDHQLAHERATGESSSKGRKNLFRLVGTVLAVITVILTLWGLTLLTIKTGIISPEELGQMLAPIVEVLK